MNQIRKYLLDKSHTAIDLPHGTQVLSVANQKGKVAMWASVPSEPGPQEEYLFRSVCTGEVMESPAVGRFIGTVLLEDGEFVVHVWASKG